MSAIFQYAPLLVCIVVFFNHGLRGTEGLKRKYYPNQPPIETIMLDNGDIIDCMDFYGQPAMRDPLVKRSMQLQLTEKILPQGTISAKNKSHESASDKLQKIDPKGRSCPPGSVPFLKATKAGPLNLSALEDFARSRARFLSKSRAIRPTCFRKSDEGEHEHAIVEVKKGKYYGAEGTLNVWQPVVQYSTEMSLSQVWLSRRYGLLKKLMTLEAGWMVNPAVFGDFETRFFYFTTNDDYKTSLYGSDMKMPDDNNLQFVVHNNDGIPFGNQITPTSSYAGEQHEIEITIKKNDDGNWELFFDNKLIGYWPSNNYPDKFPSATGVEWGGEIVNEWRSRKHTTTQMGSGYFAREGIGRAAYISNMRLFDENMNLYNAPDGLKVTMTNSKCYDVMDWPYHNQYGRYITMGGPGYDKKKCP